MSQLSPTPTKTTTLLSNTNYNILKHVAAIGLPALAALYYAIAQIWHISHPGQIMATISAINAFLGAILGISTAQYNSNSKYNGVLEVIDAMDKKTFALNLGDTNLDDLENMSEVILKVTSVPPSSASTGTHENSPASGA